MKKVYQRIVDANKGDCMQATMASLFDEEYENVPPFIELGDGWFSEMLKFIKERGYSYDGEFHNKQWSRVLMPTGSCFQEDKWHNPSMLTKANLRKSGGVNGFFFAVVLSPKFFNYNEGFTKTHAVVCDVNFNIVHDPSPVYQNILKYPLSDVIGKNGIISVYDLKCIDK